MCWPRTFHTPCPMNLAAFQPPGGAVVGCRVWRALLLLTACCRYVAEFDAFNFDELLRLTASAFCCSLSLALHASLECLLSLRAPWLVRCVRFLVCSLVLLCE